MENQVRTMEDLLVELKAQLPVLDQQALTTGEMAQRLGVGEPAVRRLLRQLKGAGLVKVVNKKVPTLNGRTTTATAWGLT